MGWNNDVKRIVEFIPRFESMHREMLSIDKENNRIDKLISDYSSTFELLPLRFDEIVESINNTNERIDEIEKEPGYDDSRLKEELISEILSVKKDIEASISNIKNELGNIEIPIEYDDSGLKNEIKKISRKVEEIIDIYKENSKSSSLEIGEIHKKVHSIESELNNINELIVDKQEETNLSKEIEDVLDKVNSIKLNVEKSLKSFGAVEVASLRKEMARISRELEAVKNGEH